MNLDKLKELAEKATPGPWEINEKYEQVWSPSTGNYISACDMEHYSKSADAEYIAAVSPDVVIGLIEEIKNLGRTNERIKKLVWDKEPTIMNRLACAETNEGLLRSALQSLKIGDCWCSAWRWHKDKDRRVHTDACIQVQELFK